jgi:hypothetical protein
MTMDPAVLAEARNVKFLSRALISILVHDVESLVNKQVPTSVECHYVDHHTSGTVAREKCIRAGALGDMVLVLLTSRLPSVF